eukprot:Lithocolla_globosa_v1_NODE_4143_length_1502_cov_6.677263.p3 type:complete len:109 gc:universal NODE_4143_length_1502_cov_6.677263:680-354(-)
MGLSSRKGISLKKWRLFERNHGCVLIPSILMRCDGSTHNIRRSRFSAGRETWLGTLKSPFWTRCSKVPMCASSKGSEPVSSAYRITPHDQMSAPAPSYLHPITTSGQA